MVRRTIYIVLFLAGLAGSCLLFYPVGGSWRSVATVDPNTTPLIVRQALRGRSEHPNRIYLWTADSLIRPRPHEDMNLWRIRKYVFSVRLRVFAGLERTSAYYAATAHYGSRADGIEAAARRYFCIEPGELSISQTATLSRLTNEPQGFNLQEGRDRILGRMLSKGELSAAEFQAATEAPIEFCRN